MNLGTISSSQGVFAPFSDKRVSISYAGRPHDYQMYRIDKKAAESKAVEFSERMGYKFGDIFMPDISGANGRVGLKARFERSKLEPRILNSEKADGIVLDRGQMAVFATGDCPVVVMHVPQKDFVVAAHAGRQSLLGDVTKPVGQGLSQSVIFDMARRFSFNELRSVEVAIVLSIAGEHFEHDPNHPEEKYRQVNGYMIDFVSKIYGDDCFVDKGRGSLSLVRLIKAQCKMIGVNLKNVASDKIDTFSTKLPDGTSAFWSNRRGDSGRNIVLVSMD